MTQRRMTRRKFMGMAAASVGGLTLSQAFPRPAAAADIKIGALFPYSGPMALLGEEMFRGAEIAREMINEKGGILGNKIVYAKGDAPDATAATSEAERLINMERVKVILGSYSSALSYPASEVAERNKVIYWEVGATADAITQRGFRYLFRVVQLGSNLGEVAAEYAAKVVAPMLKMDPKQMRVGQLYEDTIYGTTTGGAAQVRAKELGLNVVLSETYSQKAVDLSSIVLKLKALKPDVIIVTQYISDGILFWRQAKELGLNVKALIGTGGAQGLPDFPKALGEDANLVLNSDPAVGLNTASMTPRAQQELKAFIDRFNKKHGYTPAVHATLGYLGATVLFRDVLPKAGGVDPDKIREVAGQLDIADGDTIMGWGIKFAPPEHKNAGQNLRSHAVMMQWHEGKLYVVYPEKWAVRKVTLPLPTWEERRKK
jgi:branched-chain amino acid transport system substrate-binding protein